MFINVVTKDSNGEVRNAIINTDQIVMVSNLNGIFHMTLITGHTFEVLDDEIMDKLLN